MDRSLERATGRAARSTGRLSRRRAALLACLAIALGALPACEPVRIRYPEGIPWGVAPEYHFDYQSYTLPNGLKVVLAPDPTSTTVAVDLRYFVGAGDEVKGKTGLAHLAKHASFMLRSPTGETLAARLEASALVYQGQTDPIRTHYRSVALAARLPELLTLEAQRMNPRCDQLAPELLAREQELVRQELAQRHASWLLFIELRRAIWGGDHPYANEGGGEDIAGLTRANVCEFLERNYTPNRAALIISGAFSPAVAQGLVTQLFGPLANRTPVELRLPPPLPAPHGITKVQLDVSYPVAALVFPLEPLGSPQRTVQGFAIWHLANALERFASTHPHTLGGGIFQFGGAHRSAALLYLEGFEGADLSRLLEDIHATIEDLILRIEFQQDDDWFEAFRNSSALRMAARHENSTLRGMALGDASQFTAEPYRGQDIERALKLSTKELLQALRTTFHRARAQALHIEKRPGSPERVMLTDAGGSLDSFDPLDSFDRDNPHVRQNPLDPIDRDEAPAATEHVAPARLEVPAYAEVGALDYQLKNGLRVVLVPRARGELLEARLMFPVGAATDPAGRDGTARLTASLLGYPGDSLLPEDRGSLGRAYRTGVLPRGEVSSTATEFRITGNRRNAKLHLWQLHTLLANGELDEGLLRAHQQRISSYLQAQAGLGTVDSQRAANRYRAEMWSKLFGPGHPFLRGFFSAPELRLRLADLETFRAEHYVANGAVLVVVGDFDPREMAKAIGAMWGHWPMRPRVARALVPPLAPMPGPTYVALDQQAAQLDLTVAFAARSTPMADAAPRRILTALLQLRIAALQERLAIPHGISAAYLDLPAGSLLRIEGSIDAQRASASLRALLDELDPDRGNPGELERQIERARRHAFELTLARGSSTSAVAGSILHAISRGLPFDHERQLASAIALVKPADVIALLRKDLDASRMMVGAIGPEAAAALSAAGAKHVTIVK